MCILYTSSTHGFTNYFAHHVNIYAFLYIYIVKGRPIEFHWYAAEEVGLIGSLAVAEDYAKRKISVVSMLNMDQSGCKFISFHFPQDTHINFYMYVCAFA